MRFFNASILATTLLLGACSTGPVNDAGKSEAASAIARTSSASSSVSGSHSDGRSPSVSTSAPSATSSASQTPLREPETDTLNRFYTYLETTMSQNLETANMRDKNNHLTPKAKEEILNSLPQSCLNSPATDMSRAEYVKVYGAETVTDANVLVTKDQARKGAESFWDVCHLPTIEVASQLIKSEHHP